MQLCILHLALGILAKSNLEKKELPRLKNNLGSQGVISLYPPYLQTPKVYPPLPVFETPFKDVMEPSPPPCPRHFSKMTIEKKRTPPFEK